MKRQEAKAEQGDKEALSVRYSVALDALNSSTCPLSPEERAEAIRKGQARPRPPCLEVGSNWPNRLSPAFP